MNCHKGNKKLWKYSNINLIDKKKYTLKYIEEEEQIFISSYSYKDS